MLTKLMLIRGIPGSGKTTMAKAMLKFCPEGTAHYEADMFRLDSAGNYFHDASKNAYCHSECFKLTKESLLLGNSVIVSNTFTRKWEMQNYIDMAKELNVTVTIIIARGNYKSIHDVDKETIERMKAKWEE